MSYTQQLDPLEDSLDSIHSQDGFEQQLREHGCVSPDATEICLPGPAQGDLDNDVILLFSRQGSCKSWPDNLYSAFLPSFRLATLYMTQPTLREWWRHTFYGVLTHDDDSQRYYLQPHEDEASPDADAAVRSKLDELARVTNVRFDHATNPMIKAAHTMAKTSHSNGRYEVVLHLNSSHYILHGNRSPSRDAIFYWAVAITLCHEVAHAFYNYTHKAVALPGNQEPHHFLAERWAELGFSWECAVLDAITKFRISASEGITAPFAEPVIHVPKGPLPIRFRENLVYFPVRAVWAHAMLLKETWASDGLGSNGFKMEYLDMGIARKDSQSRWQWTTNKKLLRCLLERNEDLLYESIEIAKDQKYRIVETYREELLDAMYDEEDEEWQPKSKGRKKGSKGKRKSSHLLF